MNKQLTLLFSLLAVNFALSTFIKPYPLSWAVKLLPMLLLIGVSWQLLKDKTVAGKFFVAGLVFSACGDFILDYDRGNWFIFGLGAFFIAHLCYLVSLKPYIKNWRQVKCYIALVCYLIYGALMLTILANGLGELFIPVVAYMSILLLMALATIFSEKSNVWLVVGGISFVLSDSLIGFDKFYLPIDNVHFAIMVSYYFAQFALLKGFSQSFKRNP
jgi:uncharacterized membrane protein YhhN